MTKDEMKENAMRFEVEGVLENVLPDMMFYLSDNYAKEESLVWAKVFKQVFNDMVDSVLKEREDEEEE